MQIMVQLKISKFQLFDKFLKPIADKDGMIDIEGIFDEEMEVINNIDNFNFDIPFIGGGNISKGIISLEVPYVNAIKKYYLMMLSLVMFMLQLMLNIMIMLNCLKNGLVVI